MNIEPLNISPLFLLLLIIFIFCIFGAITLIINGYITRKQTLKAVSEKLDPIVENVNLWLANSKGELSRATSELNTMKLILKQKFNIDFEEVQRLEARKIELEQKNLIKKEGKNE